MKQRRLIVILLVFYILILLRLIIFKYPSQAIIFHLADGNFIPGKTIINYLSGEPTWHIALRNLAGNIILFIPLGTALPFIFYGFSWKKALLAGSSVSFLFELIQAVTLAGIFDIDDIILNTAGVLVGYFIFTAANKLIAIKNL